MKAHFPGLHHHRSDQHDAPPISDQEAMRKISLPESAVPRAHVRNRFELTVDGPYKIAAPLFGPIGERSWADEDWDPQFIYPHPPKDRKGAVFTINHGRHQSVWVNTAFDIRARHFQYVYFVSDVVVTVITLTFLPLDADKTKVDVVYERTALSPKANEHVEKLGATDRGNGKRWEKAINDYLARQKQEARIQKPKVYSPRMDANECRQNLCLRVFG